MISNCVLWVIFRFVHFEIEISTFNKFYSLCLRIVRFEYVIIKNASLDLQYSKKFVYTEHYLCTHPSSFIIFCFIIVYFLRIYALFWIILSYDLLYIELLYILYQNHTYEFIVIPYKINTKQLASFFKIQPIYKGSYF